MLLLLPILLGLGSLAPIVNAALTESCSCDSLGRYSATSVGRQILALPVCLLMYAPNCLLQAYLGFTQTTGTTEERVRQCLAACNADTQCNTFTIEKYGTLGFSPAEMG